MEEYTNICDICGKFLTADDGYFVVSDTQNQKTVVCEDCAKTTSIYDLYLKDRLSMRNSPDDIIEVAAITDSSDATPDEVEKFFTSKGPDFT